MPNDVAPSLATVMRVGYSARGIIYTVLGGLTIWAAITAARAEGTTDALRSVKSQPFGQVLLWVIAIGLFCYLIWRVCDAVLDLECYGTDGKGIIARLGQVTTGLLHGALGLSVASLAMGAGASGTATQDWTARLMSMDYGRWIVGAVALITIGAGLYYVQKGVRETYKKTLRRSTTTERLDPLLKWGLIVHGGIVGLIGLSIGHAALYTDPQQAGGLGQALTIIRDMAFGRVLLALTGLGLFGFAAFNFVQAVYRIVPRLAEEDVATLAKRSVS